MMKKIVLASGNRHKLEEIQTMLADFGFELVTMKDAGYGDEDIVEDGDTFEANSMIKALAVHKKLGFASLADDSGLMVDALGGSPGVYSARFAGEPKSDENNNNLLLEKLAGIPDEARTARFVTLLTLIMENGDVLTARGEVEGIIGHTPKGTNGFGYDPLFYVPLLSKTFAELTSDEKNALSHRGNALVALKEKIGQYYEALSRQ